MSHEERQVRIARTEMLYRSHNDAIAAALQAGLYERATGYDFLCECADDACRQMLHIEAQAWPSSRR